MNKQDQRKAIEEACGWVFDYIRDGAMYYVPSRDIHVGDPLTDLNAMHQAENTLFDGKMKTYASNLGGSTNNDNHRGWETLSNYHCFPILHATALQRAEAFLKTIGKWTES